METEAHRLKLLIPLVLIVAVPAILFYIKVNDGPNKSRVDVETYELLKKELKEDLHIKDSYNPFD